MQFKMYLTRRQFIQKSSFSFLSFGVLSSCKYKKKKPNLVFVLADQWRASATGYMGDPNVKTPNLDKLAQESVNFQNAVSVCPVCTPYRAALMTGQYPTTNGMFLNDLYLPDEANCLGEIFKNAGYQTAYIGKWHLDGHGRQSYIPPERRQGFQYWKVAECEHNYLHSHYYAGNSLEKRFWKGYDAFAQTQDASQYIRNHTNKDRPFFLFVSYGPPHFPLHTAPKRYRDLYSPCSLKLPPNVPEEMLERTRKEASGYYAHCTAIDECIGNLLQVVYKSGIAEHTIFVFTSDHGEMMGSHGVPPCEKQRPWDESIRVPFLLRYPFVHGRLGRHIDTPINTPDIMPTLLSLAGLPIPSNVEGEDLSDFVHEKSIIRERAASIMSVSPFAGYHGGNEFRGIRTNSYTYVRSLEGPWLFFDNKRDPYQMKNLLGNPEYADLQRELDSRLWEELRKIGDDFQPRSYYLEKWNYQVNDRGYIPYRHLHKVQGPSMSVVN